MDEAEMLLGIGEGVFERAVLSLQSWKMFDLGWMQATPSAESIAPSVNVAVVVKHLGFWSLNGCRVVYMISSEGRTERYGFAYGTLNDHAEEGEELFEVRLERGMRALHLRPARGRRVGPGSRGEHQGEAGDPRSSRSHGVKGRYGNSTVGATAF